MKKSDWLAIAEVLNGLRAAVVSSWPPREGYMANALEAHDRKLVYLAQLEQVDKVALVLAATLDKRCASFNRHEFLRIVNRQLTEA
jgi:ABC-type transporter Mla MlaB component